MISREQIFPSVMILLCVASAIVYAYGGDVRKTLYWAAAAVLNIVITF